MAFLSFGPKSTALHRIARKGNEHELLRLLRQGADVTARDAEGRTPLHLAVMRGHMGIINGLLEHGGPAVLLSRDILNCTPVHLAAVQNQVQLITLLIDALLEDTSGCTPLHEVAKRGCRQDFLGFLHLGWDIAACDGRNQEVLQLTEDASKTGISTVQQILGWSALHLAAMEGKVSNIEKLIKTFNCDVQCQSANTWTPLHYAAAYNQVGSIEALIRLGAKVNIRDSVGSTPLHVACGEGHLAAVMKLIELGGDPGTKDRDGCTPLYCACAWNQIEVVRKLHSLKCSCLVQSEEGRTAVHVAAEQGWVDLIRILVQELGCKVDSAAKCQVTPLHSAANWGWVDAISKLVELKHAVDVKDNIGQTPLHYAALHGRAAAIQRLVKLGATLKEKDSRGGFTPLHLAADAGQCEAVAKLVELGADTEAKTSKGWTCLQLATMKGPGNADVIGLLVELGANLKYVNDDRNVETPLHIAARAGRKDVVLNLITHGADVMARTKDGSTPLHYAAAFGQVHVIEPLVKAGCSVHSRDNPKNTPLHLAAGCGFLEAVVKLVELGSDLDARDMSECTPLQNTAHGTYSALAHVPPGVAANSTGQLQGLGSLSLRRSGLSSAIFPKNSNNSHCSNNSSHSSTSDESGSYGGMVPVRTGFAWATFGNTESLSSMYLNELDSSSGSVSSTSSTTRLSSNWKGAELMSFLRKATRGMRSGSLVFNPDTIIDSSGPNERVHGSGGGGGEDSSDDWEKWTHRDFEREREGLELLLRKTEALQMSHMEQDRSRLLPVAEKLVDLGANIAARDNEGRTALHLAAGCGDKLMVLKLVDLGADVNSRDSVGGTAMHHAAMANKKEMMFTLALLGCDWRAKADGIDGASPAFVLCGQHGKTTRQQKLLEAKLKRVYLGGEAARKTERGCFEETWDRSQELEDDYEEKVERADANMAALLEEVAAEEAAAAAASAAQKPSRKKNKKQNLENPPPSPSAHKPPAKRSTETGKKENLKIRQKQDSVDKSVNTLLVTSSANVTVASPSPPSKASIRQALEEAVNCAIFVLEIGEVAGKDAMLDVMEKINHAINHALHNKVGAKYAKKVRKKLQSLIEKHLAEAPKGVVRGSDAKHGGEEVEQGWVKAPSGRNKGTHRKTFSAHSNAPQPISPQQQHHQHKKNLSLSAIGQKKESRQGSQSSIFPKEPVRHLSIGPSPCNRKDENLKSFPSLIASPLLGQTSEKLTATQNPHPIVRTSTVESAQMKNASKGAWEHGQKTSGSKSCCPLSDPDFPPLKSANVPSVSSSHSSSIGNRKTESTKGTHSHCSQDSGENGTKTDTDTASLAVQSISSTSSTSVSIAEQSPVEKFPQYELFGNSASPALSSALCSGRNQFSDSSFHTVTANPNGYAPDPENAIYSIGEVVDRSPSVPVMMMPSTGFAHMSSYPMLMMPTIYPPMSYEANMGPYSQTLYACPHMQTPVPSYGLSHQYLPSMQAMPVHPMQSEGVQHGTMDSEEIANKLPKEIPGLVESEAEKEEDGSEKQVQMQYPEKKGPVSSMYCQETYLHHHHHAYFAGGGPNPPVDSQILIADHLLGALASDLEA